MAFWVGLVIGQPLMIGLATDMTVFSRIHPRYYFRPTDGYGCANAKHYANGTVAWCEASCQ